MALGKSVAGAGLKITLELPSAFQGLESGVKSELPGNELGRVRTMAAVVISKALLQIGGMAVLEVIRGQTRSEECMRKTLLSFPP